MFTHVYAEKRLFHVEKRSRTFMQRKVYFMWRTVHLLSWLVHGISLIVFDPMVLVRGIASKSVDPKYWVHAIVLLWFWTVVL